MAGEPNGIGVSMTFSDAHRYSYFLDGLWHGKTFIQTKSIQINGYRFKGKVNGLKMFEGISKRYLLNRYTFL